MSLTDGQRIRLLIADDDPLVRAGLIGILGTADDLEVVAETADGRAAVAAADSHRLDVALLDIRMPRLDGIGALRELRVRHPRLPVAMLTTFSDEHLIADAVGAGALGFLLKSDEPEQLIAGVRALHRGGAAFSPPVARWLAEREHAGTASARVHDQLTEVLTARQLELLTHIGRGWSNAQIATAMGLSEGTVKQYVSALFIDLDVDNRVHAAVMAYRGGLLDDDGGTSTFDSSAPGDHDRR